MEVKPERDNEGSKVAVAVPDALRVRGDRVAERLRVSEEEGRRLRDGESVGVKVKVADVVRVPSDSDTVWLGEVPVGKLAVRVRDAEWVAERLHESVTASVQDGCPLPVSVGLALADRLELSVCVEPDTVMERAEPDWETDGLALWVRVCVPVLVGPAIGVKVRVTEAVGEVDGDGVPGRETEGDMVAVGLGGVAVGGERVKVRVALPGVSIDRVREADDWVGVSRDRVGVPLAVGVLVPNMDREGDGEVRVQVRVAVAGLRVWVKVLLAVAVRVGTRDWLRVGLSVAVGVEDRVGGLCVQSWSQWVCRMPTVPSGLSP